ncbi:SDR family NAD(P)-dependent oxidoreductase [Aeromicrobium choanae]|uniref:3-oxoacyl-[acyl-carrier protein] reductase n=1 Tax=Aeromicrobium choanae TaxID=1736691 RepID=A0A1T4Z4T3_9ACTN|nr:SDR family oxidoreductase [Aeromicrobium choanae]SKB08868.1 3-oxoacyl-[acyl-carrier protein] reductase [Aeromicrobium choanae]
MTNMTQHADAYDVAGRVAVITGSGRGIGRACALDLARSGANIVLTSRTVAELDEVAAEIEALGSSALVIPGDVADYESCSRMAQTAFDAFGQIDILINNAGAGGPCTVADSDPSVWAGIISLNLIGPFNMTHAVLPHMIKAGSGRIVMIGSGLGHNAVAGLSAYGASKAGLSHLTKILADEVWAHGIDVNEVVPGPVITKLTEGLVAVGEAPDGLPSERVKTPEEVGDLIGWLLRQRVGGPTGQIFSLARRSL